MGMTTEKFRKMSTARLEQVMANGAMVKDRNLARWEYARRIDRKAAALLSERAPKTNEVSVNIQVYGVGGRAATELAEVLTRAMTEALGQVRTPRP